MRRMGCPLELMVAKGTRVGQDGLDVLALQAEEVASPRSLLDRRAGGAGTTWARS